MTVTARPGIDTSAEAWALDARRSDDVDTVAALDVRPMGEAARGDDVVGIAGRFSAYTALKLERVLGEVGLIAEWLPRVVGGRRTCLGRCKSCNRLDPYIFGIQRSLLARLRNQHFSEIRFQTERHCYGAARMT
jgi:hypothetical protein